MDIETKTPKNHHSKRKGYKEKCCLFFNSKPVQKCCCGCSLYCSTLTIAVYQINLSSINGVYLYFFFRFYALTNDTLEGLESTFGYQYDDIKGRINAIMIVSLVYCGVQFASGVIGLLSQYSKKSAMVYYYSFLTYLILYIALTIVVVALSVRLGGYGYQIILGQSLANFGLFLLLQIYFVLVVWSNWQMQRKHYLKLQQEDNKQVIQVQVFNQPQPMQFQQYQIAQPQPLMMGGQMNNQAMSPVKFNVNGQTQFQK